MTKGCTPSQTDVIFVDMDALARIYEDDLIATSNMTVILQPSALRSGLFLLHRSPLRGARLCIGPREMLQCVL